MSWGGAPPRVYKQEIAYHQSQANVASAEARRANDIALNQIEENQKCQKRLKLFKTEISKLESTLNQMKDIKEISFKTFDQIMLSLNEFRKILASK